MTLEYSAENCVRLLYSLDAQHCLKKWQQYIYNIQYTPLWTIFNLCRLWIQFVNYREQKRAVLREKEKHMYVYRRKERDKGRAHKNRAINWKLSTLSWANRLLPGRCTYIALNTTAPSVSVSVFVCILYSASVCIFGWLRELYTGSLCLLWL